MMRNTTALETQKHNTKKNGTYPRHAMPRHTNHNCEVFETQPTEPILGLDRSRLIRRILPIHYVIIKLNIYVFRKKTMHLCLRVI